MKHYIEQLQDAIRRLHGCESQYLESVDVTERYQDQIVWDGTVEVFQIRGHPKAKRAYAWAHASGKDDQRKRFVAVLELPPVTSAQTAVRAAVMSEIKDAREKEKSR
jgi:hypothetical protein